MNRRIMLVVISLAVLALGFAAAGGDPEEPKRRPRRLYFGAPPAISHDAGPDMNECLLCHGDPDMGAPLTPHPTRLRCRQCHVASNETAGEFRASKFVGLPWPGRSPKVQPNGPRLIPHPILLREKCLACHAPDAREDVVSTTHPERLRCRQCHIPQRAKVVQFPKRR